MKKDNKAPEKIKSLDELMKVIDEDKLRNVYGGIRDRRDHGAVLQ